MALIGVITIVGAEKWRNPDDAPFSCAAPLIPSFNGGLLPKESPTAN
ncbi:hypothetical protein [Nonomuraea insulae]|uniref:Uncharacterized protein n=1 Tax=Nonomuraea insulae TaxID=1616787 RepID=A0ABW1D6T7_9ACTN